MSEKIPTDIPAGPLLWADNSLAKKEEKNWPDEDALQGVKRKNDILWMRIYGWICAFMMLFFTLVFVVSLGAWIIHHVTSFCWLTPEQLSKIQSVIFSGSIGAIVSSYMQKQLSK